MVTEKPIFLPSAELTNVADMWQLEKECFGPNAWSSSQIEAELLRPNGIQRLLVCPIDQHLVGMTLGWQIQDEAELIRIAVAPRHRRSGLGKRLMHDFLGHVTATGGRSCFLEVRADNTAAIGLYSFHKFSRYAIRENYYRDGCDAWMMRNLIQK